MDTRMNGFPGDVPGRQSADVAEALDRERRVERLGSALSSLRVFLVLSVQCYLLLGLALIYIRPPSGAFCVAMIVLVTNTLLFGGCLVRALWIRRELLRLATDCEAGGNP